MSCFLRQHDSTEINVMVKPVFFGSQLQSKCHPEQSEGTSKFDE